MHLHWLHSQFIVNFKPNTVLRHTYRLLFKIFCHKKCEWGQAWLLNRALYGPACWWSSRCGVGMCGTTLAQQVIHGFQGSVEPLWGHYPSTSQLIKNSVSHGVIMCMHTLNMWGGEKKVPAKHPILFFPPIPPWSFYLNCIMSYCVYF